MDFDRDARICGVRPAGLKRLLGRYQFSTPKAMGVLELEEPSISHTLLALRDEGWIDYIETIDFVDYWRTGARGRRLTASKLIKRFPAAEGRKIVERVIARAREINANPNISHRITEIRLFGSVLTAADDEDVGDVDLVVDTQRRRISEVDLKRIEDLEDASAPYYLGFLDRQYWSERESRRTIKKVSARISLHPDGDLRAIGASFKTVFRLDIETETEISFDANVRSYPPEAVCDDRPDEASRSSPAIAYRFAWPTAPNESGVLQPTDIEALMLAQHMWVRGAPVSTIADAIKAAPVAAQAYLATCGNGKGPDVRFDASLLVTVAQVLPRTRTYYVKATVEIMSERGSWGDVTLFDAETHETLVRMRQNSPSKATVSGRCDLISISRPMLEATWKWLERMRSRSSGVSLKAKTFIGPKDAIGARQQTEAPDFRPLAAPMIDLLTKILPVPRPRYAAYDQRLEIELGDQLRINLVDGGRYGPGRQSHRILKNRAGKVWDMAKSINAYRKDASRFADTLTVYVSGYQLPDHGDTDGDIYDGSDDD